MSWSSPPDDDTAEVTVVRKTVRFVARWGSDEYIRVQVHPR